jgi:hypothetical protein
LLNEIISKYCTSQVDHTSWSLLVVAEVALLSMYSNFYSPLLFESGYFSQLVADANWDKVGMTLICMEEIDVKYRKSGDAALKDLSRDARNFFLAFACVDRCDRFGNGTARLILSFAVGEGMRAKLLLDPFQIAPTALPLLAE